jgi:anaphase-promoting complex subunit 6
VRKGFECIATEGHGLICRSHLPLLFIGMEHLQLSSIDLAEEYFLAAQSINNSDPLLLNELGVVAYNKEE